MITSPLQQELDDLTPVVAAWDRRQRAFEFVVRARPYQLEHALIEWVLASHELVAAARECAESADFRHQVDVLERVG